MRIETASSADPLVRSLLEKHPRIDRVLPGDTPGIEFVQSGWRRRVLAGGSSAWMGLPELVDNNPLVCADEFSVPGPLATLAAIAIRPLVTAGLLVDAPVVISNIEPESDDLSAYVGSDILVQVDTVDLGSVAAITTLAEIGHVEDPDELDELFSECYGRSHFVRLCADEWDTSFVLGKPHAAYRLRISPGDSTSILGIQVMADKQGKCGATQLVHAMNVMAGFEESLALDG